MSLLRQVSALNSELSDGVLPRPHAGLSRSLLNTDHYHTVHTTLQPYSSRKPACAMAASNSSAYLDLFGGTQ